MQLNPWERAIKQLDNALRFLDIDDVTHQSLIHPNRIIEASLPLEMDDGTVKVFKGYRVQHNNLLGPYKGGLRFHKDVDINEAKALSFWMTIKNAVVDLPFGGGKGGISVDPKSLSEKELERLTRLFVNKFFDVIGPEKDVPAPDVNTNPIIMAWIVDEYSKLVGANTPAVVTGKPIEYGGSEGRIKSTGLGGVFVLTEIFKLLGIEYRGMTVAIQGFGNVGMFLAKYLHEEGFKVVALTDSKGGIYQEDGFKDIDIIEVCKKEKGRLSECYCVGGVCDITNREKLNGKDISPNEVLELPVDIVIPAAMESSITGENAGKIQAKYILEMANGPTTIEAEEKLNDNKKIVIPDVLANTGGVIVSYFEWYQNLFDEKWSNEKVIEDLKEKITTAARNVFENSKKYDCNLRDAAFITGLNRLQKEGSE